MQQEFENVFVFDHPLIQHKISLMRDINTTTKDFRELVSEVGMLMAYEVTRNFELEDWDVETPICKTTVKILSHKNKVTLVPVLRAGLGMVDGFLKILPQVRVGHIGLYRDHDTKMPVEYYCKLPDDVADTQVILLDPMLATGGSAVAATNFIKQRGCKNIRWVSIISAPEGIKALHEAHPDIPVFCGCVDEKLNENAYIVPGLGDCGDRLFGTK
ncbi:MAG: uracil phosphoribosyltransferase [Lachnospiraceae bacterium]|nr:uracil phosphoribosyltransferase [Lachnospiraceae bacterium]